LPEPALQRKVLVVEDNTDTADTLRLLLELWGYQVRVAFNGLDGLSMAQEWAPEVVLSDLGLPGVNGFVLARALRSFGMRLIAITGYGSEAFRQLALESGFQEVLVKPANLNELARLLEG
jgi:DNA-binding response OmpR family regulator